MTSEQAELMINLLKSTCTLLTILNVFFLISFFLGRSKL